MIDLSNLISHVIKIILLSNQMLRNSADQMLASFTTWNCLWFPSQKLVKFSIVHTFLPPTFPINSQGTGNQLLRSFFSWFCVITYPFFFFFFAKNIPFQKPMHQFIYAITTTTRTQTWLRIHSLRFVQELMWSSFNDHHAVQTSGEYFASHKKARGIPFQHHLSFSSAKFARYGIFLEANKSENFRCRC